jgi:hypothetical protein
MKTASPAKIIKDLGGTNQHGRPNISKAAKALRCSRTALYNWSEAGAVPDLYQYRYAELMAGRKAPK